MGYTTKFKGRLVLSFTDTDKAIIAINKVNAMGEIRHEGEEYPGYYMQWEIIEDNGYYLQWDHNEKFYNYNEWLVYLIENIFIDAGIVLNGTLRYSGEDSEDMGEIVLDDNKIIIHT